MRALAGLLTLALSVGIAHADDTKDTDVALGLSAGGTLASAALIAADWNHGPGALGWIGIASLTVTPSLGEWYSGKFATKGLALRLVAPLAGVAVYALMPCQPRDGGEFCEPSNEAFKLGAGTMVAVAAAGAIYDIATAPRTARNYNAEHAIITPTTLRTPSGSAYGLALTAKF